MGWLSDSLFGKRKKIDADKVQDYMKPTQDLMDEQIGMARAMMDPNSEMNRNMTNQMQDTAHTQAREAGAQSAMQMRQLAAQTGMSPGQAAMQQRMSMQQAQSQTGGIDMSMQKYLQSQQQAGLGVMGNMSQQQQSMNENSANAYVQQINAHNAARQSRVGMVAGLAQGAMSMVAPSFAKEPSSDIRLKENIELVGKSPKGVNIYEFDYKDKSYGEGRYKGVMAQEVPNASLKDKDGYLRVNYNKLDVNFERIS